MSADHDFYCAVCKLPIVWRDALPGWVVMDFDRYLGAMSGVDLDHEHRLSHIPQPLEIAAAVKEIVRIEKELR